MIGEEKKEQKTARQALLELCVNRHKNDYQLFWSMVLSRRRIHVNNTDFVRTWKYYCMCAFLVEIKEEKVLWKNEPNWLFEMSSCQRQIYICKKLNEHTQNSKKIFEHTSYAVKEVRIVVTKFTHISDWITTEHIKSKIDWQLVYVSSVFRNRTLKSMPLKYREVKI